VKYVPIYWLVHLLNNATATSTAVFDSKATSEAPALIADDVQRQTTQKREGR
jgi:hypothetical protein